jgi:hypothetical protein
MTQETAPVIQIRRVSQVHALVTQQAPKADCTYAYQFVLDDGAAEVVWQLTEGDADQIQDLLTSSDSVSYDVERQTLIFKNITSD